MEKKPWYASKIIQLNAIAAALVVAEANVGMFQQLLPVNFYAIVATALPLLNAILRLFTTKAVSLTAKAASR